MKLILPTILLSLTFIVPLKSLPTFNQSIPIQSEGGSNFCSSWSINEKDHLYVTAAHCVDESTQGTEDGPPVPHIRGMRTTLIMFDRVDDLAVVSGPFGSPALHFQSDPPYIGEDIVIVGYPYGGEQTVGFGRVASLHQKLLDGEIKTIFAVVGAAPGSSGSPIMNTRKEVISVLQQGWNGGLVGGTPWEVVVRVLRRYQP